VQQTHITTSSFHRVGRWHSTQTIYVSIMIGQCWVLSASSTSAVCIYSCFHSLISSRITMRHG